MKSAYYFLAVVLLALVGLSVLSLLLVNAPVAPGGHAPPPRVVFVDLGKLAALHPDTAVLDKMSALAREAGPLPTSTGPLACSPGLRAIGVPDPVKPPEIARPEIEAEIAQSAVGAFNRLDAEQRQAQPGPLGRAVEIDDLLAEDEQEKKSQQQQHDAGQPGQPPKIGRIFALQR